MQLLMADKPLTARAGTYTVQLSRLNRNLPVWRVEVLTGGPVAQTVEELTRSYESEPIARGIARIITRTLRDGGTVCDAREAVCGWLDTQMEFSTVDDSIAAVAEVAQYQRLKAFFESEDMKAWSAKLIADMNAHLDRVHGVASPASTVPGNADNGQSVQVTADAERMTLATLARQGEHRQVPPTLAGAHQAELSEPQRFAIDAAFSLGGTIRRGKSFPLPLLKALARKGFATLNYAANRGKRRVVESATLTDRGRREAGMAVTR